MPNTSSKVDSAIDPLRIAEKITEVVAAILSTAFLSGINIVVSGHLLGYALSISGEEEATNDGNVFWLRIPYIFSIRVRGALVVAGFTAYSVSLALTGTILPKYAKLIFIDNLNATTSQWNACQGLAALVSVVFCLMLAAFRLLFDLWRAKELTNTRKVEVDTPEARVKKLVSDNERRNG